MVWRWGLIALEDVWREKERDGLEAWGDIEMEAWWVSFALPSAYPSVSRIWPLLLPGPRTPTTVLNFSEHSLSTPSTHGSDGWVREEQVDQIEFSLTFPTGFLLLRFLWPGPTETSSAYTVTLHLSDLFSSCQNQLCFPYSNLAVSKPVWWIGSKGLLTISLGCYSHDSTSFLKVFLKLICISHTT